MHFYHVSGNVQNEFFLLKQIHLIGEGSIDQKLHTYSPAF